VIAVLHDVHGNLAALDAVLEDARGAGAEQWILGGDYALFGGWPAETVARLRELEPAAPVSDLRSFAPEPGPEDEDLSKTRGRYDCVAVKREVTNGGKVVGLLGHPFVGTADFKRFTYVWCKDNKVPGERGKPLAKVPIPAVCIGAEGRPRVGDGYLSASP
jgi:hypothetical protein